MNQATALIFVLNPLNAVLIPEAPWLSAIVTLLPNICLFTQSLIIGTHEQLLNSIKFMINIIGLGYAVAGMLNHSFNWRVVGAIYSFYWDVV